MSFENRRVITMGRSLSIFEKCMLLVSFVIFTYAQAFSQVLPDNLISDTIILADTLKPEMEELNAPSSEIDSLVKENIRLLSLINPTDTNYRNLMHEYDLLITRRWEIRIVKVKNIQKDKIEFLYPLNTQLFSINRDETSQILYADGKSEVFYPLEKRNTKDSGGIDRVIIRDKKDWEKVIVVQQADEVPSPFVEIGNVDALFEADRINAPNDFLEKNALIILRKKTANIEGYYLLVTNKKVSRAYGEIPIITLEGKVFGYERIEEP
jgi:hypothetical protein